MTAEKRCNNFWKRRKVLFDGKQKTSAVLNRHEEESETSKPNVSVI
jgi:hypothetical protein